MAQQLAMPIEGGRRRDGDTSSPRRQAAASGSAHSGPVRRHRARIAGNRPVRGEPDLPEPQATRADWRIDPRTRDVGLRGLARARAALAATTHPDPRPDQVDAA